jgi:hypothetical protein
MMRQRNSTPRDRATGTLSKQRGRSARLVIVLWLAVQIGVPIRQLFSPRQARFGWQMFSSRPQAPVVIAVREGGARDTLRLDDYFAFRRGDMSSSYIDRLPQHLCRVAPGVKRLIIHRSWRSPAEFHSCG